MAECKHLHLPEPPCPRIHVLFMIDELCEMGGAERVLLKIIRRLPPERFRVSLITFRKDESIEELKRLPCPVYVLPLRKTYDLNALRTAATIRRFIRAQQVSIVHTFFETSDLWGGVIARLSGCPVLISSRRDLGILRRGKHRIAYRLMNRLYDRVLAVSPQVRRYCIAHDRLPPERVQVLFNGLEMKKVNSAAERMEMRREMGIAPGAPVIVTVANVRKVKGLDVLVLAAAEVCRKYPDVLFAIVGRKTEQEYCRELAVMIEHLDLTRNFRFLGSYEEPYSLLKMSDVFCLPSRSEGFSNALIEAMACRLPCVATDVGGNREALEDGVSGFLVASEDPSEMAAGILKLLDNRDLAAQMGAQGEEIVLKKFTLDTMMAELITSYDALLAAKGYRP